MPRNGGARRSKRSRNKLRNTPEHLCEIGDLETLKIIYDLHNTDAAYIIELASTAVLNNHYHIYQYFISSITLQDTSIKRMLVTRLLLENIDSISVLKYMITSKEILDLYYFILHYSNENTILSLCKDEQCSSLFIHNVDAVIMVCSRRGMYNVVTYLIENILESPIYKDLPRVVPIFNLEFGSSYKCYLAKALSSSSVKLCKYFIEEKKVIDLNNFEKDIRDYDAYIIDAFIFDRVTIIAYLFKLGYTDYSELRHSNVIPLLNYGVDVNIFAHSDNPLITRKLSIVLANRIKRQNAIFNVAISCTNLISDTIHIINQYVEY